MFPVSKIGLRASLQQRMLEIGPLSSPDVVHHQSLREAAIGQMERILAHQMFLKSPRLSQLFRYLVEMSIAGEAHLLKEYTIAVDVFKRPVNFDCRLDSIVRVEVARLRKKLALFYKTIGSEHKIVVTLPASGYEPRLYIWDHSHFSAAPVIAVVGEQDSKMAAWVRELYEHRMKVIHLSRESVKSFGGMIDLIVVFLASAETPASVRWVLDCPIRATGAILFVSPEQSDKCSLALRGAVAAIGGEEEPTASFGRFSSPQGLGTLPPLSAPPPG